MHGKWLIVWIILPIGSHHSKPWRFRFGWVFDIFVVLWHRKNWPFKKGRDLKNCRIAIGGIHVFWQFSMSILIANKKPLDPKTHEKMKVLHLPKYRWNPPIGNIYHLYTIDNKLPNTWDPNHWPSHWPSPRGYIQHFVAPRLAPKRVFISVPWLFGSTNSQGKTRITWTDRQVFGPPSFKGLPIKP